MIATHFSLLLLLPFLTEGLFWNLFNQQQPPSMFPVGSCCQYSPPILQQAEPKYVVTPPSPPPPEYPTPPPYKIQPYESFHMPTLPPLPPPMPLPTFPPMIMPTLPPMIMPTLPPFPAFPTLPPFQPFPPPQVGASYNVHPPSYNVQPPTPSYSVGHQQQQIPTIPPPQPTVFAVGQPATKDVAVEGRENFPTSGHISAPSAPAHPPIMPPAIPPKEETEETHVQGRSSYQNNQR